MVLALLGRRADARTLAQDELDRAERFGAARPIALALRAMAATEDPPRRRVLVERSISLLRPLGADLELARAYLELGLALRQERRPRESRLPLRAALEGAARCGAVRLERQARDELAASGARPRRIAVIGTDALTASERRVAELAAGGSTNRTIAQLLFVSEKTVETHLSHVYDKLGTRSRRSLSQALAATEPHRRRHRSQLKPPVTTVRGAGS